LSEALIPAVAIAIGHQIASLKQSQLIDTLHGGDVSQ
jgi:hypothetical protein